MIRWWRREGGGIRVVRSRGGRESRCSRKETRVVVTASLWKVRQQSAQAASGDMNDEQDSAATGDEGSIEQDIGGGTDLSSDYLFDALARSPTEDEVGPSLGQG